MQIERTGNDIRLGRATRIDADVRPPGSKSLTNRYLTCLALADGAVTLQNAGICDDTEAMVDGLEMLGLRCELDAARRRIQLWGKGGLLPAGEAEINVGAAGTTMRFLTALACLGQGQYRLDGSPRMRQRPIAALVDALADLGARIGYELAEGCPPLTIAARGLAGGNVVFTEPPSSQYVSALLMVAPYAARDVYIEFEGALPSRPYVDMTLDVMAALGVEVIESDDQQRMIIPASQYYHAQDCDVEPDASGATYLWGAAALTGGRVRVTGLTRQSRQGDARFVDVLAEMGCAVDEGADYLEVTGPRPGNLRGVDADLNLMPDTAQTLAVLGLFTDGPTNIRNVPNLRIKETDRIAALATELSKMGAAVEPRDDGLRITPPAAVKPATIDTYDDHRMAMSFAMAAARVDGIVIRDADCVRKSFPDFFEVLGSLDAGG